MQSLALSLASLSCFFFFFTFYSLYFDFFCAFDSAFLSSGEFPVIPRGKFPLPFPSPFLLPYRPASCSNQAASNIVIAYGICNKPFHDKVTGRGKKKFDLLDIFTNRYTEVILLYSVFPQIKGRNTDEEGWEKRLTAREGMETVRGWCFDFSFLFHAKNSAAVLVT